MEGRCVEVRFLKNSAGEVGVAVELLKVALSADGPVVEASDEDTDLLDVALVSSTARQCSIARTISPLHPSKTNFRT